MGGAERCFGGGQRDESHGPCVGVGGRASASRGIWLVSNEMHAQDGVWCWEMRQHVCHHVGDEVVCGKGELAAIAGASDAIGCVAVPGVARRRQAR